MSERIYLGVDIGVSGAITIMTPDGALLDAIDIPTLNDGPLGGE